MSSHRPLRIAEAIREVVATAILFEIKDPRVHSVTVHKVEVAGDLRNAVIFVSIMGDEKDRKRILKGLESSTGFLQSRVADRLKIRYTPFLRFELDESIAKSIELSRIIDDAVAEDRAFHESKQPAAPDAIPEDAEA